MTKTRAARLLSSALDGGELTRDQLAGALGLSSAELDRIVDGSEVMSLSHQSLLSTLLIERVPRLARSAHTLRAQVAATKAFAQQETESHSHAPMSWRSVR
jgi:hypothetical protein